MCNRRSWNWKPWGLSVLKSVLIVWTRSPLLKTGPYLEICEPDPFFDSRTEGLLHQVKWRHHRYSIIKHFLFFPTAVNGQHRWEHAVKFIGHVYGDHWPCFTTGAHLKTAGTLTPGWDGTIPGLWITSTKSSGAQEGHSTKWGLLCSSLTYE